MGWNYVMVSNYLNTNKSCERLLFSNQIPIQWYTPTIDFEFWKLKPQKVKIFNLQSFWEYLKFSSLVHYICDIERVFANIIQINQRFIKKTKKKSVLEFFNPFKFIKFFLISKLFLLNLFKVLIFNGFCNNIKIIFEFYQNYILSYWWSFHHLFFVII